MPPNLTNEERLEGAKMRYQELIRALHESQDIENHLLRFRSGLIDQYPGLEKTIENIVEFQSDLHKAIGQLVSCYQDELSVELPQAEGGINVGIDRESLIIARLSAID